MLEYQARIEQAALYLCVPWKLSRLKEQSCIERYEIIDGSGRGLSIVRDWNKPRFKVIGQFPDRLTSRYHRACKSIGFNPERPAKDIAVDIKRRFLPTYLERFEQSKQAKSEECASDSELKIIADAIMKVTGGHESGHHCCTSRRMVHFLGGSAEVTAGQCINLTLHSLSAEQGISILAALFLSPAQVDEC
ncbi:hypothetical protein ABVF61_19135 [Roseibium sp. HPY-6]|uniref:hypothetical protein n=1 Tax=Roseibium sp. HPY-6 TaxID=3229852 RepID=UPI00338D46F6